MRNENLTVNGSRTVLTIYKNHAFLPMGESELELELLFQFLQVEGGWQTRDSPNSGILSIISRGRLNNSSSKERYLSRTKSPQVSEWVRLPWNSSEQIQLDFQMWCCPAPLDFFQNNGLEPDRVELNNYSKSLPHHPFTDCCSLSGQWSRRDSGVNTLQLSTTNFPANVICFTPTANCTLSIPPKTDIARIEFSH